MERPASLAVKDGAITAVIFWSGIHYGYMMVGERRHEPVKLILNAGPDDDPQPVYFFRLR